CIASVPRCRFLTGAQLLNISPATLPFFDQSGQRSPKSLVVNISFVVVVIVVFVVVVVVLIVFVVVVVLVVVVVVVVV
ncbi:unnamed protein product, partial [Polarella glacialis]